MNIVFHIGLHKTATTWFQKVFYPFHKQLHNIIDSSAPWNDPIMCALIKTQESRFNASEWRDVVESSVANRNVSEGDVVVISAERLSGHPASGGADRFLIARRIHQAFPSAKIFCALRNQVEMIDDIYRTMLLEGYSGSIEQLIRDDSWKTASPRWSFFDYLPLYEVYTSTFGVNNCYFNCFEHMRIDPIDYLSRLCHFLSIEVDLPPSETIHRKINTGLPKAGNGFLRRINSFRRTEYHPNPPVVLPDSIYSLFKYIFGFLPQRASVLSDSQMMTIRKLYAESNAKLAEKIGGDMKGYLLKYCL